MWKVVEQGCVEQGCGRPWIKAMSRTVEGCGVDISFSKLPCGTGRWSRCRAVEQGCGRLWSRAVWSRAV